MSIFSVFRSFARKNTPHKMYEEFKSGFKEPEPEFLKDNDFFKGYEEVIEAPDLQSSRGMLTICPTPIGNLRDISIRQYQALKSADILACEDTRITGMLLLLLKDLSFSESKTLDFPPKALANEELDEFTFSLSEDFISHTVQIVKKNREEKGRGIMISLNSYNQEQRAPKLIKAMKSGIRVVMVSDAGTPMVSDPGSLLVQEAIKHGISIESLPGPVAAITALTLSGFRTDNFFFQGYMPKTLSEKIGKLEKLKKNGCTSLIYESSHRIIKTAESICNVFGDLHQVFVAQELTKMHERVYRGSALEVLKQLKAESVNKGKIYGEITVVISPFIEEKKENTVEIDVGQLVSTLEDYVEATPQALAKIVHYVTGWNYKKITRMFYDVKKNKELESESESEENSESEEIENKIDPEFKKKIDKFKRYIKESGKNAD